MAFCTLEYVRRVAQSLPSWHVLEPVITPEDYGWDSRMSEHRCAPHPKPSTVFMLTCDGARNALKSACMRTLVEEGTGMTRHVRGMQAEAS